MDKREKKPTDSVGANSIEPGNTNRITPCEIPPAIQGQQKSVLKSSAIIGFSSIMTLGLGMVRTKIVATLLGPSGVGLLGIYNSIATLATGLAGLGLGSSAVRQISKSAATGDHNAISRSFLALRRCAILLGLTGAAALALLAGPVSRFSFGNSDHLQAVALLGIGVFFATLGGAQGTLIQGMRRMRQVAMINIYSAVAGTAISVPILVIWGLQGIALSCVVVLISNSLVSWLYVRRVSLPSVKLSLQETWRESEGMLRLGLGFLSAGLMAAASNYLARIIVLKYTDEEGAGMFQAAYVLSMVYVGFILQAMGTDYYPKLSGVANDNKSCARVVNDQVEISILLGLPGVLGTIALAHLVIPLFYDQGFASAVDILRWQSASALMRLASYPMSYLLVAKGESMVFTILEGIFTVLQMIVLWCGVKYFGLVGSGVAYLIVYLFYWPTLLILIKRRYGVRWDSSNFKLAGFSLAAVLFSLGACVMFSKHVALGICLVTTTIATWICVKKLLHHSGVGSFRQAWVIFASKLGSRPS